LFDFNQNGEIFMFADISSFENLQQNAHKEMGLSGDISVFNTPPIFPSEGVPEEHSVRISRTDPNVLPDHVDIAYQRFHSYEEMLDNDIQTLSDYQKRKTARNNARVELTEEVIKVTRELGERLEEAKANLDAEAVGRFQRQHEAFGNIGTLVKKKETEIARLESTIISPKNSLPDESLN
jgi:hypothetical protein